MAPAPRPIKFRPYAAPLAALALFSATAFLSGCGSFFSCEGKASCPACVSTASVSCPTTGSGSGGSGSSTDDFAYVANSSAAATSVDAYNIGAGALTAVSGSPFPLGYSPVSMVVNPKDTFLYAASDSATSTGAIYGYNVSSTGVLSELNSTSAPQITESDAALAVSPDGTWLLTLPTVGLINVYSLNTSTGAAGASTAYSYPLTAASTGTLSPVGLAIAPSSLYIAAALETGGANVFSFVTATGQPLTGQTGALINPNTGTNGIYALAFDSNNYLYCATTVGLQVFSVAAGTASPTVTAVGTAYTLGTAPRSIAIASTTTDSVITPAYVYIGNEGDSTISAFSIGTNGALTTVAGSPFPGPNAVNSVAVDSTGKYLIASGDDTTAASATGSQLFTIGTGGVLTSAATGDTGTSNNIPGAIAATH
jgi:6-phosphogluconolactonase